MAQVLLPPPQARLDLLVPLAPLALAPRDPQLLVSRQPQRPQPLALIPQVMVPESSRVALHLHLHLRPAPGHGPRHLVLVAWQARVWPLPPQVRPRQRAPVRLDQAGLLEPKVPRPHHGLHPPLRWRAEEMTERWSPRAPARLPQLRHHLRLQHPGPGAQGRPGPVRERVQGRHGLQAHRG